MAAGPEPPWPERRSPGGPEAGRHPPPGTPAVSCRAEAPTAAGGHTSLSQPACTRVHEAARDFTPVPETLETLQRRPCHRVPSLLGEQGILFSSFLKLLT